MSIYSSFEQKLLQAHKYEYIAVFSGVINIVT